MYLPKMCYTKEASLGAFFTSVISSILLITFGSPKFKKENILIGTMFIYISFMQLIDYILYLDQDCTNGWNTLAGRVGPVLQFLQPVVLFLLYVVLLRPEQSDLGKKYFTFFVILNVGYIFAMIGLYSLYLKRNPNPCSQVKEGVRHHWIWLEDTPMVWMYSILIILNALLFIGSPLFKWVVAWMVGFYVISKINYTHHSGEFWCFFVNSIPLIILILERS